MPSGPEGDELRKHLTVVVAGPHGNANQILFVPICSIVAGHDTACIVEAWAHPWLDHDSYVDYRFGSIGWASKVEAAIRNKFFIEKDPADNWLLEDICRGAYASRRVKPFFKNTLEEWGVI